MSDLKIIKDLVEKLDGVMGMNLNLEIESDKLKLETLAKYNPEVLLLIQPSSEKYTHYKRTRGYDDTCKYSYPQGNKSIRIHNSTQIVIDKNGNEILLTKREQEILRKVSLGMSNKKIGKDLGISFSTVKVHVKNILKKLNKNSRLQAALWAIENLSNESLKNGNLYVGD